MCRCATGTPIVAAISRCNSGENSDTELLRVPLQPKLARRRHVANERRSGDDGGAGKVAFAADAHAVLPVAIERRDGALPFAKRVRSLAETRPAPRLANLAADRSKHLRDRLAAETRIGALDLSSDTARPGKDDELLGNMRRAPFARRADHQRRREQIVVAAVGARSDQRLVERDALARHLFRRKRV